MLRFKLDFPLSFLPSSRSSLVPLCFLPLKWYHLHIFSFWYFSQQSWFYHVIHPAWHFPWCTLHISYIGRVTMYSLGELFSQFLTSLLFHILILNTGFSGWSGIPNTNNFPQIFVIHRLKGFSIVNEAEIDVLLEFPCFLYDPIAILSLVPLPFLNPACTSGNSWFMYC